MSRKLRRQLAQERAVSLLTHYITLLMGRAGLKVDEDTLAELRELVEAIVTAAEP